MLYKGFVFDKITGEIKYKFETPEIPNFNPKIEGYDLMDTKKVEVGDIYDINTGEIIKKEKTPTPSPKEVYASLPNDYEKLKFIAKYLGLI